MSTVAAERNTRKKPNRQQAAPMIEFTAAAHEHVEPAFDVTLTPTTSEQASGPYDVPAYGYMRSILLEVTASGGVLGPGVLAADAPWNIFSSIELLDVNGAPLFGPYDGYSAFLANLFGGYVFQGDPSLDPDYAASGITISFFLRVPVEIQHNNGLGCLANQNSAAAYKVRFRMNTIANIWSTAPTTAPAIRVRGHLEAWSQPNPADLLGRPQATRPPRHGTSQYWTVNVKPAAVGVNTLKLDRVGNLIRNIILVNRLVSTGARDTAGLPDTIEVRWDARQLMSEPITLRRKYARERIATLTAMPAGVVLYDFNHDVLGHLGDGTPELWLPTVQATRLEFVGTWDAASNVSFLVNDIAPVETRPEQRFVEESATGFDPEVGMPLRGAA